MNTITPSIRILIAHDQDIIRVGLSHVIEAVEEIELLGTEKTGQKLVDNVVVADASLLQTPTTESTETMGPTITLSDIPVTTTLRGIGG